MNTDLSGLRLGLVLTVILGAGRDFVASAWCDLADSDLLGVWLADLAEMVVILVFEALGFFVMRLLSDAMNNS